MSAKRTMSDPVKVQAKYMRNETVSIEFKMIDKPYGEEPSGDIRTLSRTYSFDSEGIATMPFKMATILLKKHPEDFRIIVEDIEMEDLRKEAQEAQDEAESAEVGGIYQCPYCIDKAYFAKTKAGLSAHVRYNHNEQFEAFKAQKN